VHGSITQICGKSRAGKFQIKRKSRRDRVRAKLKEVKAELWRRMDGPIREQGAWLKQVSPASSTTTPSRPTCGPSQRSDTT